ncbi:MAG: DUF1996 domain-containing protein [Phycicoccus sp.]
MRFVVPLTLTPVVLLIAVAGLGSSDSSAFDARGGAYVVQHVAAEQHGHGGGSGTTASASPSVSPSEPSTSSADPAGLTDPPVSTASASAPSPTRPVSWTFCAPEYSSCTFVGTREVRFVLDGAITTKTVFKQVACNNGTFGVPEGGAGKAYCEYAEYPDGYQTTTLDNPNPGMGGLGATVTVPTGDPGRTTMAVDDGAPRGDDTDGVSAFRISCPMSHFAFDDPIVAPGKPGGSHLHMFFGNTQADAHSTTDTLVNSGGSTCAGGIANRSAYWMPAVVDGAGQVVIADDSNFYYKSSHYDGIRPDQVQPLPAGLRMIAGDKSSTTSQGQRNWGCFEKYVGHWDSIQEAANLCGPDNRLSFSLRFPHCWDGVNLDSADHQSHMSQPVDGVCPQTHPVPIPAITMNVMFDIPDSGTQGWHLASDMYDDANAGGYSAHADWWNGWNEDVMNTWVTNCVVANRNCHNHLLGDGRTLG